ncbi:MAG: paraquat-inducible protein A [Kiloniellaceae bacterium]
MPEESRPTAPLGPPRHPRSLAAAASGADRFLGPYFVIVGLLLVAGWTLPIMTVRRLVFFAERLSILEGAAVLWRSGDYVLFAVVVVFSVVFPALKTLLALWLWYGVDARGARLRRSLDWLEVLGRWSMLDVFLVALTIAAVQVSLVSDVTSHAGLYVFTAAVVLSMLGVRRLIVLARRTAP